MEETWFFWPGAVIVGLMLVPNIIYAFATKNEVIPTYHNRLVELIENIGRFGSMFFMMLHIPNVFLVEPLPFWAYLLMNVPFIIAYCLLFYLLRKTVRFVAKAIVLSLIPAAIFLFGGLFYLNIPLIVLAAVFTAFHLYISIRSAKLQLEGDEDECL